LLRVFPFVPGSKRLFFASPSFGVDLVIFFPRDFRSRNLRKFLVDPFLLLPFDDERCMLPPTALLILALRRNFCLEASQGSFFHTERA